MVGGIALEHFCVCFDQREGDGNLGGGWLVGRVKIGDVVMELGRTEDRSTV